jgi:hypothetical protein
MSAIGLVALGAGFAAIALLAACQSARRSGESGPVRRVSGPAVTIQPSAPAARTSPYVIVNTPTGPITVPREAAGQIAQQHGGDERDVYEPEEYRGQRHSNDPIGR